MTVLEIGLLYGGLPVFRKDYHKLVKNRDMDPVLRSGLLSAINTMLKETFTDSVEEFKLRNYAICVKSVDLESASLSLYAICDKNTKTKHVRSALDKLASLALDNLAGFSVLSAMDPDFFKDFDKAISKEMRDLKLKPEERATRLFLR
ncbi:MAG: hypothetical protein ACXAEU_20710 [Candidatus Hodarchaeales archaeon]